MQLSPNSSSKSVSSSKSPNTSGHSDHPKCTSKPIKDKYAHIESKVKTHWSFEEKQKFGIREFFDRKLASSAGSSATSSATTSPDKPKAIRRSLPLPGVAVQDPIAVAIAQIKRNTRLYRFSENSASTSSMASSMASIEEH